MIKKKIFIGLVAAMMLTGTAGCGNSPIDKYEGAKSTLSANTRATYGAEDGRRRKLQRRSKQQCIRTGK